jgi:hypothetical protein
VILIGEDGPDPKLCGCDPQCATWVTYSYSSKVPYLLNNDGAAAKRCLFVCPLQQGKVSGSIPGDAAVLSSPFSV